jgi:hypothetical protein
MSQHGQKDLPAGAVFVCLAAAASAFWASMFFASPFCPTEWRWLANWSGALFSGILFGTALADKQTRVCCFRIRAVWHLNGLVFTFLALNAVSDWWLPSARCYLTRPLLLLVLWLGSLVLCYHAWRTFRKLGPVPQASHLGDVPDRTRKCGTPAAQPSDNCEQ